MPPHAARLLDDPYGVVRYVARDSLRSIPGFADFDADFLASPDVRQQAVQQAIQRWQRRLRPPLTRHGPAVLVDQQGNLLIDQIQQMVSRRNDRPVSIRE